jgi:hypothetical protein
MQEDQHRRMDTKSSGIRLLRVEKSTGKDLPIALTLRHVSLDDNDFCALSYTRGNDSPTFEVLVMTVHIPDYLTYEGIYTSFCTLPVPLPRLGATSGCGSTRSVSIKMTTQSAAIRSIRWKNCTRPPERPSYDRVVRLQSITARSRLISTSLAQRHWKPLML